MRSTYSTPFKCCICGTSSINSNNAKPVKEGRCCDTCNQMQVIPARFMGLKQQRRSLDFYEILKEIRDYTKNEGRTLARVKYRAQLSNNIDETRQAAIMEFFNNDFDLTSKNKEV